jgi:hypothetical protein
MENLTGGQPGKSKARGGGKTFREQAIAAPITNRNYYNTKDKNNNRKKESRNKTRMEIGITTTAVITRIGIT